MSSVHAVYLKRPVIQHLRLSCNNFAILKISEQTWNNNLPHWVITAHSIVLFPFQATVEDENLCLLKLVNVGPGILLMSNESEQIVQAVTHVKTRWQLSQPVSFHYHLTFAERFSIDC